MSLRERYDDVVEAKGLTPKDVHTKTGVSYQLLQRLGDGPRGPCASVLREIVQGLELDANFLLETDSRYQGMKRKQAMARMALDRYVRDRSAQRRPLTEDEVSELLIVADRSEQPPLWSQEWAAHHERAQVSAKARGERARDERPQPVRAHLPRPRPRSLRP